MLGLQMRVAYSGLIYRKVKKMSCFKKIDLIDIYTGPTFIKLFFAYFQFR